jgi:hypothetical protein
LLEALRFTSGVSNCSNTRVTFKKIHNSRFTITRAQTFAAQRIESDAVRIADSCVVTASWTRGSVRIR